MQIKKLLKSLFHIHEWGKWKRTEISMTCTLPDHIGKSYEKTVQRRECAICGLIQTKEMNG